MSRKEWAPLPNHKEENKLLCAMENRRHTLGGKVRNGKRGGVASGQDTNPLGEALRLRGLDGGGGGFSGDQHQHLYEDQRQQALAAPIVRRAFQDGAPGTAAAASPSQRVGVKQSPSLPSLADLAKAKEAGTGSATSTTRSTSATKPMTTANRAATDALMRQRQRRRLMSERRAEAQRLARAKAAALAASPDATATSLFESVSTSLDWQLNALSLSEAKTLLYSLRRSGTLRKRGFAWRRRWVGRWVELRGRM